MNSLTELSESFQQGECLNIGTLMELNLHHIGIAVADIDTATADYRRRLRCELAGGRYHDPVQTALIQFLRLPGDSVLIELVAPDGPASRLSNAVRKGGGINHVCHSTPDIDEACRALSEEGMMVIQEPTPAVAFGGRRIAWLMGDDRVLTELVERPAAEFPDLMPL
jgi:methylmalonyl-CoA/ethylmalonyl-CoA epimerase